MNESDYHVFFSYSEGIGPKTFLKLLSHFNTAENIYYATDTELIDGGLTQKNLEKLNAFRKSFDLQQVLDQLNTKKIWVLPYSEFPEELKSISNPPIVLYGKGDKKILFHDKKIGIVGSRRPTSYGINITEGFTKDLCSFGFTIVSGMALGIDSIAHRATIKNNGKTIAVLGSGVDLPTPAEHGGLYMDIIKSGGAVVSEFPMGMYPNKGSFPSRNRIISGLSQSILIPEATADSGALITAKEGFSQGRKVFVVPGPITSLLSKGTNSLLSHGGIPVASVGEIFKEFKIKNQNKKGKNPIQNLKLTGKELQIVKAIENENLTVDQIARLTKIGVGEIMVVLTDLELREIVKNIDGKWSI